MKLQVSLTKPEEVDTETQRFLEKKGISKIANLDP